MSEKILNHFNSYEWNGLFWFPEDSEKKFSGKVTYSPERGIRIQLILLDNTPYSFSDGIKRKIMHGAVQGEDLTFITLVNLSLYPSKMLLSQQSLASMEGNVSYLISGIHCKDDNFKKLRFQYDEQFESIFFYPIKKDTQLVKYSKGPKVQLNNCTVISMDMETQGHFLLSGEEIDTLFWSNDKDKIEKLKACVDNIMTDESFDLNKITSLRCVFDFENSEPSLLKIFELEEKWRSFWEFLLDQELLPISIWVDVRFQNPHDGKSYSDFKPVLKNYYKPIKQESSENARILPHLPINITSFGEAENDISVLTKGLLKWFHIRNDPKWAPVVYGINGVLNKDNFGNTARYVALVSEIETLLNHLGKKPENLDTLIDNYATQKWKDELTKVLTNLENDSLGLFLQEIRVVITHPKAASKCNGKYWNVARDQILLQKVYAYLAGLFIKAFLQELNSICYQNIEKYVDQFIELRASWHKIEYT